MPKVILKLEHDVSTDTIYPGRFMATVLPSETPAFAFADFTGFNKQLNEKTFPADSIIMGGNNFGCGSSREQAASCLKGHELIIIAKNFARIFLQNAVNLGLRTVTVPAIEAEEGDEIEIQKEKVINKTKDKSFEIIPLSGTRQAVMDAGGLIPYSRTRLMKKAGAQK
jgi:3-isopropylmalate/(R)-2-methylmalate dehydratase small subunit